MLIIAAAAAIAAMPVPQSDQAIVKPVAPVCQRTTVQRVGKAGTPLTHDLSQEPPANVYSAVLYSEGQCTKPIVVSRNVGMRPKGKDAMTSSAPISSPAMSAHPFR